MFSVLYTPREATTAPEEAWRVSGMALWPHIPSATHLTVCAIDPILQTKRLRLRKLMSFAKVQSQVLQLHSLCFPSTLLTLGYGTQTKSGKTKLEGTGREVAGIRFGKIMASFKGTSLCSWIWPASDLGPKEAGAAEKDDSRYRQGQLTGGYFKS